MQKKDAKILLEKYRSGACTEEEKALLESWYLEWKGEAFDLTSVELKFVKDQTWNRLQEKRKKARKIPRWNRSIAASLIFALLSVGMMLYLIKKPKPEIVEPVLATAVEHDAVPGGNKAVLTLDDGTIVALDEAEKGQIARAAGITIQKAADGQLVYETMNAGHNIKEGGVLKYNRITTPRGGQYQVILPDGTKVWLNAASSLKYPVTFKKETRSVELIGEAYFEVAKQQSENGERIPFFVRTSSQTVEVLGTHFNINAYADEGEVKTTLLEGSVRVSAKSSGFSSPHTKDDIILKPNQQSVLKENSLAVKKINAATAVAWKNGYFSFEHADLKTVMRQLSRWYDVEVVYGAGLPVETFSGKVYRDMNLSKVLEILAYTQVNFKIDGKTMTILP